jgi:hypothetical protein
MGLSGAAAFAIFVQTDRQPGGFFCVYLAF